MLDRDHHLVAVVQAVGDVAGRRRGMRPVQRRDQVAVQVGDVDRLDPLAGLRQHVDGLGWQPEAGAHERGVRAVDDDVDQLGPGRVVLVGGGDPLELVRETPDPEATQPPLDRRGRTATIGDEAAGLEAAAQEVHSDEVVGRQHRPQHHRDDERRPPRVDRDEAHPGERLHRDQEGDQPDGAGHTRGARTVPGVGAELEPDEERHAHPHGDRDRIEDRERHEQRRTTASRSRCRV